MNASFCSKDRATGGDCVHQQFIEQCDLMLLLGGAGVTLNVAVSRGVGVKLWALQNHDNHDRHWMSGRRKRQSDQTYTQGLSGYVNDPWQLFNAGNGSEPSTTSSI